MSCTERYFSTSIFGATTIYIRTYGLTRNYKAILRKEAGLKMNKLNSQKWPNQSVKKWLFEIWNVWRERTPLGAQADDWELSRIIRDDLQVICDELSATKSAYSFFYEAPVLNPARRKGCTIVTSGQTWLLTFFSPFQKCFIYVIFLFFLFLIFPFLNFF